MQAHVKKWDWPRLVWKR